MAPRRSIHHSFRAPADSRDSSVAPMLPPPWKAKSAVERRQIEFGHNFVVEAQRPAHPRRSRISNGPIRPATSGKTKGRSTKRSEVTVRMTRPAKIAGEPPSKFDPRHFSWLQSERRITLEPPTPAEKKTHWCWYDKKLGFWVTQLYPLKLQAHGGAASIQKWIDLTITSYFSEIAKRRRAVELARDVRHLYLCALMEVCAQLEARNDGKSVGLARIINEVCHSLLELESSEDGLPLSSDVIENILPVSEENAHVCEKPFTGEIIRNTVQEETELRATVLKQAQIMRELQAEIDFQRKARLRAEEKLAKYEQEAALKN